MLLQAHGVAERFAADVTGEGPGPAVGAADVHFKPMRGGEHLGAGGAECGPAVGCRGRLAGALWPPHLCARLQACISMEPEEHWTADSAGICCVSWEGPFPSLSVTQFPVYKMGLEEASTQPL